MGVELFLRSMCRWHLVAVLVASGARSADRPLMWKMYGGMFRGRLLYVEVENKGMGGGLACGRSYSKGEAGCAVLEAGRLEVSSECWKLVASQRRQKCAVKRWKLLKVSHDAHVCSLVGACLSHASLTGSFVGVNGTCFESSCSQITWPKPIHSHGTWQDC